MKESIEYCTGRIEAFKEVKELLSLIRTKDEITATQLKILIDHCSDVVEIEERYVDIALESMELENVGG